MRRQSIRLVLLLCLMLALSGCTDTGARAVYGDDARIAGDDCYQIGNFSGTVDESSYGGTFQNATGSRSLWVFDASAPESRTVDCTLSLEKGRAKLVLVSPGARVDTLLEVSPSSPVDTSVLTLQLPAGESILKLVMDGASGMSIQLRFDGGRSYSAQDAP